MNNVIAFAELTWNGLKTAGTWTAATAKTIWILLKEVWKITPKIWSDVVNDWKNRDNFD